MRARRTIFAGALLLAAWMGAATAAVAGPYDGSRPLLCAVATIMECDGSGQCERHLPDDANTPRFVRVNVAGQTIVADTNRQSPIRSVSHVDGALILQGGENGRGWSATIHEDTGRMAAAIVENDYTFSIFGACTVP